MSAMTKLDAKALEAAFADWDWRAEADRDDLERFVRAYLDALPPARLMYLVADDPVAAGQTVKAVEVRELPEP